MCSCEDMFLSMCSCIIRFHRWLAHKITGRYPELSGYTRCPDVEANQQRSHVNEMKMERDMQLEEDLKNAKSERDHFHNNWMAVKAESVKEKANLMREKTEKANLTRLLSVMEREKTAVEKEKFEAFAELRKVAADRDENLRRLSEIMSSRLRDNNPNIADLDDPNRPTKLADIFSEIYDNEWTGAFEVLEDSRGEPRTIALLLDVVMEAHMFCVGLIDRQWSVIHQSILWDMDGERSVDTLKWLKDARKSHALTMLPKVHKEFEQTLKAMSLFNEDDFTKNDVKEYVTSCIRLCWLMSVQDPPVVFECPGWSSKSIDQGGQNQSQENVGPPTTQVHVGPSATQPTLNFNRDLFREYTSKGNDVEYVVWPVMFLCKNGPILKKGVAQGCN